VNAKEGGSVKPSNRKLCTVFAGLAAFAIVPAHADIPPTERAALLSLYATTGAKRIRCALSAQTTLGKQR